MFSIGGISAPAVEPRTIDVVQLARNGRHALSYGQGRQVRVWRASAE